MAKSDGRMKSRMKSEQARIKQKEMADSKKNRWRRLSRGMIHTRRNKEVWSLLVEMARE